MYELVSEKSTPQCCGRDSLVVSLVSGCEVVGSSLAGCGPSRSNRRPVALCTLAWAYSTFHPLGVGK